MTRNEYLNELKLFDEAFSNESFIFENEDWWVVIRIQIAYKLHLQLTQEKDNTKSESLKRHITYTKLSFKEKIKFRIYKSKLGLSNNSVAVFTESTHSTIIDINGNKINQYTEPFINYFKELDITFDVFDLSLKQSRFENYELINNYYFEKISSRFNKNILFQEKLLKVHSYFENKKIFNFSVYNWLKNTIVYNQSIYLSYYLFFKCNSYKSILFYCYYNNTILAINRAAKELGIKSVEYQHSLITNYHFAYSGWSDRISISQNYFPSTIWVWDNHFKELLENNFQKIENIVVINGGNVFLSNFPQTHNNIGENETIKVLLTLQGIGLPEFIKEFIKNNDNVFWYIRFHPRYSMDKKEINELLNFNITNVDIEKANDLALHDLFKMVDYHITSFSGCAIEAEHFNVKNLIFGEEGYLSYQSKIDSGEYSFIKSKIDLKKMLTERNTNNLKYLYSVKQIKNIIYSVFD